MNTPEGLYYSKEHEWIKVDGNNGTVGITDFAQSELGDVVYVELPELNKEIEKDGLLGEIESVKAASEIFCPVSAIVDEVNDSLESEPELVNSSPYEKGWIAKITIKNTDDLKQLLSAAEYQIPYFLIPIAGRLHL